MKQIIVNADDFGINETVTKEIERVIELGCVTSTTVMANGDCLDEVRRFARLHPEVSFGVHLCLSEFSSLTKSEGLFRAGLTDERGQFVRKAIFRLRSYDDWVLLAIRDELNAQIDVVSSLGFSISHADSHHHVHKIQPLKEVFADVLKSREIDKIRLCVGFDTFRSKLRLKKYFRHIKLNRFYRTNFKTANAFNSYATFVARGQHLRNGRIMELMCHPGHPAEHYKQEMCLVEGKKALTSGVELISYNNL